MTTPNLPRLALASLLTLAFTAERLAAQEAAGTPPSTTNIAPKPAEDEAILLSPFVVSASEDAGSYRATSTLAGTRLRTELKDVGSAISVVTSQFLQDTASKNNSDLLKYTAGTEVGGPSGNFFRNTDAGPSANGEAGNLLQPSNNTRVRGLTAADNTRDFFLTDIPWDSYNVGRVDIQRGPNAILFGFGSPAGIINSSLDPASFKDENKVEVRFDGQGSLRGSFSFNKVLLPQELAIRVAGVDDKQKFRQKPAYNNSKRIYAAANWRPAFLKKNGMETVLSVNFEHGKTDSNNPRSLTPGDGITGWQTNLNKATFDPAAAWDGSDPLGGQIILNNPNQVPWLGVYGHNYGQMTSVQNNGKQDQLRVFEYTDNSWGLRSDGTIDGAIDGYPFSRGLGVNTYGGYAQYVASTSPNSDLAHWYLIGATKDKYLSDKDVGLFDYYNQLLDGNNKHEWSDFETFNIRLSQTFLNNRLGIEGAFDKQKYSAGQTNGVNNTIFVDLSTKTQDGAANPNVGKAFVENDDGASEVKTDRQTTRVTAFGELRFSDFLSKGTWASLLGRHVFTGMYADEAKKQENLSFRQYAMDNAFANERGGPTRIYTVDSNLRMVNISSYLSGNLTNVSLDQAHLSGMPDNTKPVDTGSYYYLNSRWAKSTNPSDPNYVNPAALWTPGLHQGNGPSTQSENPANYVGWGNYSIGKMWSYTGGDRDQLAYSGTKSQYKIKSQAMVWQAYLWNEDLVGMLGWRKDEVSSKSHQTNHGDNSLNNYNQIQWNNFGYQDVVPVSKGESLSYSYVLHTPKALRKKLPFASNISLFYNRSRNFNPHPGDVDIFGDVLPDPVGQTKDYGVVVSVLDGRYSLKVNWFDTTVKNDRLGGFPWWQIQQWGYLTVRSAYNISHQVSGWDAATTAQGGNPATQAQLDAAAAAVYTAYGNNPVFHSFVDGWGLGNFLTNGQDPFGATVPSGITASTDSRSRGLEFEFAAEPVRNWNISLNVSKTNATQNNVGGALKQWMEAVQGLANGPAGDMRVWWGGDPGTLRTKFNQEEAAAYGYYKALEGVNVPELRPWRANLVTGYSFDQGALKGVNIGGAYRWEDKQVIGFHVKSGVNAISGLTDYVYDVQNPYYGPQENHVDLWIGYGRKITKKINWRIQLNLRDIFAEKKLVPISTEPDGTYAAYRIPELMSWQVTNTFTF